MAYSAEDFPDIKEEYREHVAANWKPHAHPETSDDRMPLDSLDVHTHPSQCNARMCTYVPSATASEHFGNDPEYGRLWGHQPEELGAKFIKKYGAKRAHSVGEALAEQARSQWSGDEAEKWW